MTEVFGWCWGHLAYIHVYLSQLITRRTAAVPRKVWNLEEPFLVCWLEKGRLRLNTDKFPDISYISYLLFCMHSYFDLVSFLSYHDISISTHHIWSNCALKKFFSFVYRRALWCFIHGNPCARLAISFGRSGTVLCSPVESTVLY